MLAGVMKILSAAVQELPADRGPTLYHVLSALCRRCLVLTKASLKSRQQVALENSWGARLKWSKLASML